MTPPSRKSLPTKCSWHAEFVKSLAYAVLFIELGVGLSGHGDNAAAGLENLEAFSERVAADGVEDSVVISENVLEFGGFVIYDLIGADPSVSTLKQPPGASPSLPSSEVVQDGSTADMIFPVGAILAYFSEVMTLNPGDIIATGTPDGVGFKRTPPRYLHAGDRVRVEIDKVGAVANPIVG